jgi:nucleotide-binding universal stress UspA family protein
MYQKILIALGNDAADLGLVAHAVELAARFNSEIILLHVADGFAARAFDQLKLCESEEMKADRDYLEKIAIDFRSKKISVEIKLALGNPPTEIVKIAEGENCDLIALAGHGHKFLGDIFHGSTITEVRHKTEIPLLVVRAKKK